MAYSYRSSQAVSAGSGKGGMNTGGYGMQCGVGGMGDGFGQGGDGFGQFDGYGQGFGQGFGQGGGFGQGFAQGGGFGYGAGGGAGGGFGGGAGGGAGSGFGGGDMLSMNGKQTMQNLNDRFSTFVHKVKDLEAANIELEAKIKELLLKRSTGSTTGEAKDYSPFLKKIDELKNQITEATKNNDALVLQIDNARMAVDDFRTKFDNEHTMCRNVEGDIVGLHKIQDELKIVTADLVVQNNGLTEELDSLKKNHEEEIKGSQVTSVGDVNVELNVAPGNDMLKKMNEMREKYEAMAERNRKEAEEQYKKQSEGLKVQMTTSQEEVKVTKSEISELRKTLQTLEIELQSQLAMKSSLEGTLAQTEGQYCAKIAQVQTQITFTEEQLEQIRAEIECQSSEYEQLLDTKSRLEQEITIYKNILEESDKTGQTAGQTTGQTTTTTTQSTTSSGGTQGPQRAR